MAIQWTESWDRAYKISFGVRDYDLSDYIIDDQNITSVNVNTTTTDDTTIPANAIVMGNVESDGFSRRGFTFKFDSTIKMSSKSTEGEKTTLVIYNIDDTLKDMINSEGCIVYVEAGYDQKTELVYGGDVVSVRSARQGSDMVYTLSLHASAFAKRNTIGVCSYEESLSEKQVLQSMINKLPGVVAPSVGLEDLSDFYKTGGRFFSGSMIKEIDTILARNNLSGTIINGKMVVVPYRITGDNLTQFSKTNYNLPLESLKSINDISQRSGVGTNDTNSKKKKLQVNTFYIPIEPAQFITIPESDYTTETKGTYIVKGRRIVLESQGNAWDVVLTVEGLD